MCRSFRSEDVYATSYLCMCIRRSVFKSSIVFVLKYLNLYMEVPVWISMEPGYGDGK